MEQMKFVVTLSSGEKTLFHVMLNLGILEKLLIGANIRTGKPMAVRSLLTPRGSGGCQTASIRARASVSMTSPPSLRSLDSPPTASTEISMCWREASRRSPAGIAGTARRTPNRPQSEEFRAQRHDPRRTEIQRLANRRHAKRAAFKKALTRGLRNVFHSSFRSQPSDGMP